MKKNIKQLIKEINAGKNLDNNLSVYVEILTNLYYEMSLLHLTMDYVTLYEVITENLPDEKQIYHTLDCINQVVNEVFKKQCDPVKLQECLTILDQERGEIIRRMQELTAHIDKLIIYEYVLNHLEYKDQKDISITLEEEEDFIKQVFQYIFASKDNQIINENIKEVIGQLPIRMSRKHYFKLLQDSLSIYKGSDQSAVDTYLYMLRSSAMLYEPNSGQIYFEEFDQLIKKLSQLDFEHLDQNTYKEMVRMQVEGAKKLVNLSDLYVNLQEMLNNLYAFLLTLPYEVTTNKKELMACKEIVAMIYDMFEEKKQKPISEYINERLVLTEGKQEEAFLEREILESILEEVYSHQRGLVTALMLGTRIEGLYRISQLMSSSIFIEFEEKKQKTADDSYIEEITEKFLSEITVLFQKNPICVNRAIIANTLNKMPVFFQSMDEVVAYIQNAMSQCQDQGEKRVCMELLGEIMENAI